ncbi:MAG: 16S rRNA (cytosine(1402)-N(4))-methyltransferase RsmH [Holophagales bacterium]|nr:16S rRNA (cytosine(1402)-N(4))-methyltransferase RsmH [Holophagales bacterium]
MTTPNPAHQVHVPVMLEEVVDALPIPDGGAAIDLTIGLGGHAQALLSKAGGGVCYLGIDRDSDALNIAKQRLGNDDRLSTLQSTYEEVWDTEEYRQWAAKCAPNGADAILADLGVSGLQLKTPERGFSFMHEGPLDMRMDAGRGPTALEWLRAQDEKSLAGALYEYGEERASRPIASAILSALGNGSLSTTLDLANAVYRVLPKEVAQRKKQIDPATRTFQAIRIAVNSELNGLARTIERAAMTLKAKGRIGVISFHSLEDRIVKQIFRRLSGVHSGPGRLPATELPKILQLISPHGIRPSEAEQMANPPSRSARLRLAQRVLCSN